MKRIAIFLMALCVGLFVSGRVDAEPKGSVKIARGGWVTTLDPHLETNFVLSATLPNIFDRLLVLDSKTGQIKPHVAESYRFVNPTLIEFKIRKGIKFSNGEILDAKAVKFSFDRILNPANKSRQSRYFKSIKSVEVADDYTVRMHLKVPDAYIDKNLSNWGYIAPPKYYGSHDKAFLARNPIGSGPYKLKSWKLRQEIVLEARNDYWQPGVPKIKTAIIKEVPEAATRVAALLAGDVDLVDRIPPQMVDRIRSNPKLEVLNYFVPRVAFVSLIVKQKPLSDVRVRKALNYAIDRDSIVKNVLKGFGRKLPLLFVPESNGYFNDIKPYPYDPKKAKSLLAEAGYPNGFDIDLVIPVGRYLMGKQIAEAVGGYLRKVGVRARVVPLEWGAARRRIVARWKPETKPFIWFGARYDMPLDADWMLAMVTAKTAYGGFNDPKLDRQIDLGRQTVDPKERRAIYHKLSEMLREEAPMVFMHQESAIYGKRPRLVFPRRYDGQFRLYEASIKE